MNDTQKRIFLLIFALLFLFTLLTAQEDDDDIEKVKKFITKKRVNAAYVMFGFNHVGVGTMNDFLYSEGLPTVVEDYMSLGFGGHIIQNKIVIGFEVAKMFEKESKTVKEFSTALSAKYSLLNIGYLAHSNGGLMYYPTLGFGLGELKLTVRENNIQSFGDFTGYQKGSESRRLGILFNVGVALDYFHKYNSKKKGKNSMVIGIRAGYMYTPMRFKWKVNHVSVPDGPRAALNGFYIRFVFGLGGYIENLIRVAIN